MSNIGVEEKGDVIIVHLKGDLYIENMKEAENLLNEQVSKNPKVIGVDCQNLDYIDSSAIAALVRIVKTAMSKNIELLFYDLNSSIMQIFQTVNLDKFFTLTTKAKFEEKYKYKL